MKAYKIYCVAITLTALIFIAGFFTIFFHADYDSKVLVKLNLKEATIPVNHAVTAWSSCLEKLNYDSDVAFLGDSITRGGDFQKYFEDIKVINLGYGGDIIKGVTNRLSMVKAVSPEKIFLLIGINDLTNYNVDMCAKSYSELLQKMKNNFPDTTIYVQSILPISKEKEKTKCFNSTIEKLNKQIKSLCEEYKITYIDLYSVFSKDNQLNPELTKDGIHLKDEAYKVWTDAIRSYIA